MIRDNRFIRHAYVDRLQERPDYGSDSDKEPAKASASFPGLLYFILRTTDQYETSHIVSWQPHGRSFAIRDQADFVKEVMSK